jgi:hypothetical protein
MAIGAALVVFSAIGLLSGGDDGAAAASADEPTSEATSAATSEPTAAATPTPTAEATEAASETASATPSATPEPTETPTPEPTAVTFSDAEVEAFIDGLRAAGAAKDVELLMSWLHPAVFERYGEQACRDYLTTTELALDVTVREVFEPAPWEWVTNDGSGGVFENAIEIEIARLVGSQTLVQLLHLVPEGGELRWLTDCGEPLTG